MTSKICVCQHKTCRKQRSTEVLAAFQQHLPDGVVVEGSGCLGQCGNGPMVLMLPEKVWYCRVLPDEVPAMVQRHVMQGQPLPALLYRKFHLVNGTP
ncbi:MAG: (2Fe-2S) ferredoxin domain-containing protein [Leptolyngbyaceae cyanobacterium SL_7_1]|nr:(2Fe-2S) ferredoxin domain-containing protein [Leptolyngbyaceae cyanobacterium SL_7_1]